MPSVCADAVPGLQVHRSVKEGVQIMGIPSTTLCGRRVILRPIDIERDADEWFVAMQEPDMHVWTGNTIPADVDEVRNVVLMTYVTHPKILSWAIRESGTGRMVGLYWIGAPFVSDDGKLVTFDAQRIAKPYWRKGYTREARSLVYQYAFAELGVEEIYAQAWELNINSCRSMESAGFQLLEVRSQFNQKHNSELKQRDYVLRRETWERLYNGTTMDPVK